MNNMENQMEKTEIKSVAGAVGLAESLVITRRDYFAAAALQGLLANSYHDGIDQPLSLANSEEIATMARDQADHLIKALAL